MNGKAPSSRRRFLVGAAVAVLIVALAAMAMVTVGSPDSGDDPGRPVSEVDATPEPGGPAVPCTGAMCGEDTGSDECRGEMCGDVGSVTPCGEACSDATEVDPIGEPCPAADPMCGRLGPEVFGAA